jgi:hypothetical protein
MVRPAGRTHLERVQASLHQYLSTHVIPAKAGIQEGEMRQPCVYILASQRNGTLYTGVTSDLIKAGVGTQK